MGGSGRVVVVVVAAVGWLGVGVSLALIPRERDQGAGGGGGTRCRGGRGDKKWIRVSLSHSFIYFKSEPYLHTAHRQALSAPTSAQIFKTISAVQRQPECRMRQAVAV